MNRIARALLLSCLLATGLGCASLAADAQPEVSLVNISVSEVTTLETALVLELRVLNPGDAEIVVDGASFSTWLGGIKVGRGLSAERVTVPRLGSKTLEVPFYVNNITVLTRLIPALEAGTIGYRLKSKLTLDGMIRRNVRDSTNGTLNLEEPARLIDNLGRR